MAVKVSNTSPIHNGIAPLSGGKITATGTVDEDTPLLEASIQPVNGGPPTNCDEGATSVAAKGTWTFHFSAQAGVQYYLTVQGTNNNGIGSSEITIQVPAARGNGAKKRKGKPGTGPSTQ